MDIYAIGFILTFVVSTVALTFLRDEEDDDLFAIVLALTWPIAVPVAVFVVGLSACVGALCKVHKGLVWLTRRLWFDET